MTKTIQDACRELEKKIKDDEKLGFKYCKVTPDYDQARNTNLFNRLFGKMPLVISVGVRNIDRADELFPGEEKWTKDIPVRTQRTWKGFPIRIVRIPNWVSTWD